MAAILHKAGCCCPNFCDQCSGTQPSVVVTTSGSCPDVRLYPAFPGPYYRCDAAGTYVYEEYLVYDEDMVCGWIWNATLSGGGTSEVYLWHNMQTGLFKIWVQRATYIGDAWLEVDYDTGWQAQNIECIDGIVTGSAQITGDDDDRCPDCIVQITWGA